ncbi:MAG TPA: LysM peptidoglycan-binding domain-containing M23 family metallopeptidase [Fredinandcohnia sp.]|nr:LysM peptidoglycan-binding domain-containing M23 family metallopeptidase [Fredinandcohnia sp.]
MSGWFARGLVLSALALGACAPPKATWTRRPDPRPAGTATRPPPVSVDGAGGHGGGGPVHVVREGETLYSIARRYGVDLDELMDRNEISDPRTLAVGRELVLPPPRPTAGGTPTRAASAVQVASAGSAPPPPPSTSVQRAPPPSGAPALRWPVKGVVHSRFGPRGKVRHDGIDIAAPEGTPIHAAADGEVIFAGVQRGYGNLVILRHEGGWVTIYAHNRKNLVREGDRVRQGQVIGEVGRTGRATGPHVHFEVRKGTSPVDPQSILPR